MFRRLLKRYRARKAFRKICPGHAAMLDCIDCDYAEIVHGVRICHLAKQIGLEDD